MSQDSTKTKHTIKKSLTKQKPDVVQLWFRGNKYDEGFCFISKFYPVFCHGIAAQAMNADLRTSPPETEMRMLGVPAAWEPSQCVKIKSLARFALVDELGIQC